MIPIEIRIPLSLAHDVKPFLEQWCLESGARLLGYRKSQDINEVVCLVQLVHDSHRFQQGTVLQQALQQHTISSFHFIHGSILTLSSPTILTQIVHFPLTVGDSWVPALDNPERIYLSLPRALMTGKQSAWLLHSEDIVWEYL